MKTKYPTFFIVPVKSARKEMWGNLFVLFVLLILSGCTTAKDTIVLLQDADGKVGLITVTTKGGSKTLTVPDTMLEITGSGARTSDPKKVDHDRIDSLFNDSMKALPTEPVTFVLYFMHDTTELTTKSKSMIPDVLSLIHGMQSKGIFCEINIVGHTDTTGDDEYNMRLSSIRAEIIRDILISHGIRSSLMELRYHGARDPAVRTGENVREPRNRRVEVVVK